MPPTPSYRTNGCNTGDKHATEVRYHLVYDADIGITEMCRPVRKKNVDGDVGFADSESPPDEVVNVFVGEALD
jgi:hypothetical protein